MREQPGNCVHVCVAAVAVVAVVVVLHVNNATSCCCRLEEPRSSASLRGREEEEPAAQWRVRAGVCRVGEGGRGRGGVRLQQRKRQTDGPDNAAM